MTAEARPSTPPLAAVLGIGASSPIGYGMRPIQAAMAGGLSDFQESRVLGLYGEPARSSRLLEVGEETPRVERLAVLTRLAVSDLLEGSRVALSKDIPVFVGMSSDAPESDLRAIGKAVVEAASGQIDANTATIQGQGWGRIAFLWAMARAIRFLTDGGGELALVVAADTRCTTDAINALIRERRLLTDQDDGTIPGEAAVAVLVTPPGSTAARQHGRFLLAGPAFAADEPKAIRQSPQKTDGLGRVFRALRKHPAIGSSRPAAVVAFGSGELTFTRTFTTGYLRNAELMPEPLLHDLIATNLGDTGAAAAGMALVRADWHIHRAESDENRRILIYGHTDDGRCAAAMAIRLSDESRRNG